AGGRDPSLIDQANNAGGSAADQREAQANRTDPLDLPPTQRDLLAEERAWLKDTNRIRKARNLPLKTEADIPAEITQRAVARARSMR
ncbi:MAG: hypothetical protein H6705_19180, partial [Myxococcales bacterium]|nr:hypothetical protein [Myxococcales bacterium]